MIYCREYALLGIKAVWFRASCEQGGPNRASALLRDLRGVNRGGEREVGDASKQRVVDAFEIFGLCRQCMVFDGCSGGVDSGFSIVGNVRTHGLGTTRHNDT